MLGAAGGVGLTAVEIGKAMGARVIAAAGGMGKIGGGALTGRRRADRLQGGKHPRSGAHADRRQGCRCRLRPDRRIQAVPANLILVKNVSVIGVVWGAQAERDPARISGNLAELLRWWEAGRLTPLVAKVFPLPEAGAPGAAPSSRSAVRCS